MPIMQIHTLILGIAMLSVACTPKSVNAPEDNTPDIEAITAVSRARAEAFNQQDSYEIARHFTEDAVLMAPGKPAMRGRDSVQAYYQSIFDDYEPELDSRYEEVEVLGDLAYGCGVATVKLTPEKGGEPVVSTAKYLNILWRQPDGTWKTTHDIWNSNEIIE